MSKKLKEIRDIFYDPKLRRRTKFINKANKIENKKVSKDLNPADAEYNAVLKEVVVRNVKDEYAYISRAFEKGLVGVDEAYEEVLYMSDGNLKAAMKPKTNDRTGVGTYKIPSARMVFDLKEGFPLLTTKKIFTRQMLEELFWFIKGDTSLRTLANKNVTIWNEWPYQNYLKSEGLEDKYPKYSKAWTEHMAEFIEKIKEDDDFNNKYGDLGPIYGAQWRNFNGHDDFKTGLEKAIAEKPEFKKELQSLAKRYGEEALFADEQLQDLSKGVDQLSNLIDKLKNNPNDRRMLVFAYNAQEVTKQALPACHAFFQTVVKDGELHMTMYQRSCDMFLGVPFNIASYATFAHLLAQVADLKPGTFTHVLGDTHIYANHIDQVQEQLEQPQNPAPTLKLDSSIKNIEDFNIDNVKFKGIAKAKVIKAPVAV